MVLNVAIVGHSQTPRMYSYQNVNIHIFKGRGAKIDDVYQSGSKLNRVLQYSWDIVFLFIGGNDICDKPPSVVVEELIALRHQIHSRYVYITAIEPRYYTLAKEIQYRITTKEYNTRAKIANNRLKRFAERNYYRNILICPEYLYGSPDGVHLGEIGNNSLIIKYKKVIRYIQYSDVNEM